MSDLTPAHDAGIDREAVLKHLKMSPKDPAVQALLLACERYGLDPLLRQAVLIKSDLYITRDGLLALAHRSGQLDGIVLEDQGKDDDGGWYAVVSVYRKDMSYPFRYRGRYNGANKKFGPEMAVKVAECMGLKRAFDVSMGTAEERWDTPEGAIEVESRSEPDRLPVGSPSPSDTPPPLSEGDGTSPVEQVERVLGPVDVVADDDRSNPVAAFHAAARDVAGLTPYDESEVRHAATFTATSEATSNWRDMDREARDAATELLVAVKSGERELWRSANSGHLIVRFKTVGGDDDDGSAVAATQPELADADWAAQLTAAIGRVSGVGEGRALMMARKIADKAGVEPPGSFDAIGGEVAATLLADLEAMSG